MQDKIFLSILCLNEASDKMKSNKRIIGFDLARSYAIFGMYIVNFNIVFGNYNDTSIAGKFLSLFSGNSSTVFVMLAGMGMALMTSRRAYAYEERRKLRNTISKRACFLFGLGLLLSLWWPADILHFYGGYMLIAALLLFLDKKYYLYAAAVAVIVFHALLFIIPYETGWDLETLQYEGFWTINGFLRSTFYNGWNSIFPWFTYFAVGMYLGRLDWTLSKTQFRSFAIGLVLYLSVLLLQVIAGYLPLNEEIKLFINADYLPPFLPFVVSTLGFGLMLIAFFMYIGKFLSENSLAKNLAKTGQMTLTHYIAHLTVGMLILGVVTNREYAAKMNDKEPVHPLIIFGFAMAYFVVSYYFSKLWAKRFKNGPFEMLMRKISD